MGIFILIGLVVAIVIIAIARNRLKSTPGTPPGGTEAGGGANGAKKS